uniref:Ovule protein n=1 Tax=Mesocestoides corti TaxID=53468 RepID=A0A5K3EHS2_MESCO
MDITNREMAECCWRIVKQVSMMFCIVQMSVFDYYFLLIISIHPLSIISSSYRCGLQLKRIKFRRSVRGSFESVVYIIKSCSKCNGSCYLVPGWRRLLACEPE